MNGGSPGTGCVLRGAPPPRHIFHPKFFGSTRCGVPSHSRLPAWRQKSQDGSAQLGLANPVGGSGEKPEAPPGGASPCLIARRWGRGPRGRGLCLPCFLSQGRGRWLDWVTTTEKRGRRTNGRAMCLVLTPRWCSFQPESWELSSPPAPAPPPPPRGLRSRVLPCPGLVCSPPQAGLHPLAGSCARTQIRGHLAGPHPPQLPDPEP